MPFSDQQAALLVSFGVSKINHFNRVMCEDETLRELDDRKLTIVTVCYAASLAKLTKLNLHDFLALVVGAYQNVEITNKEATPPTETDPGSEKANG